MNGTRFVILLLLLAVASAIAIWSGVPRDDLGGAENGPPGAAAVGD